MIKELIKLANHLDSRGLAKEADYLDGVIKRAAGEKVHPIGGDAYRVQTGRRAWGLWMSVTLNGYRYKQSDDTRYRGRIVVIDTPSPNWGSIAPEHDEKFEGVTMAEAATKIKGIKNKYKDKLTLGAREIEKIKEETGDDYAKGRAYEEGIFFVNTPAAAKLRLVELL